MEYIKIKDILEFKKKSKIKASEGLKIGKYNFYTSSKEQNKFLDYYEYSNEALIIGTGGNANIHHSYGKFSVSTDCFVLENKANKFFLLEYIYKYLLKNIHIIENGFRGAGLKHISKEYLENIEIPIISLEKQKKLIKNLKNIDTFIDKNKQIKNELNFLNKSLFTRMFGTPEYNEKGWNFISLKDISYTKGEYGSNKPAINYNGGYRYIRITDINATGELKTEKVGVSDEEIEAQKYALKENDILFARSGATVGKNFLYNKKYGKCIFAGYLIRFKLNPHLISTKYLKIYLDTNYYWNWVKNCQNIVAQPNINAKQYGEDLKIMLPPIELQNKFAERAEKIEKLSFEIEKSIKEAQNLYNSLMNKYFD